MGIQLVNMFKPELDMVVDEIIKEVVVKALMSANDRFLELPASSSGKYHPLYAQGKGGLLRHTKAAVYFAKLILELDTCDDLAFYEKDYIYSALILHDVCKYGIKNENNSTVDNHPVIISGLPIELEVYEIIHWEAIVCLIESHMGQWNTYKGGSMPIPLTKAEKFVHYCDYLASRREIHLDIFEDKDLKKIELSKSTKAAKTVNRGFNKPQATQTWREDPITSGQTAEIRRLLKTKVADDLDEEEYIKLLDKAKDSNTTKGEASDIISFLRGELAELKLLDDN